MDTRNQSVLALFKSLCDQQDAVTAKLQSCTDSKLADALSTENMEIMHRIVLAQNLLFAADSATLKQSVQGVTAGAADLQTALAKIQKATDVVTAVSGYLALVDKAIDLAKTVAAA